ncbi:MAG TPA: alpha/beta hydrolase [Ardenticatenaceae bacterium]|nr:alpha/beta hydrolase [Ardenticatenaceae bacterium]
MQSLSRDGIALCYELTKGGKPPLVLVHGWCCDHTYFAPQIEHFARRGHSVVAVDLRGHGQSDKPHQQYTMQAFADDVGWMCEQLNIVKPVIVGHSMGGVVAFDVATRFPALPSAIVLLDAAVVLPAGARATIPHFLEALRGPGYQRALREYVAHSLFIATDDPYRKQRILDGMSAAPQHVLVSAFEGLRDYDPKERSGVLSVPGLYVAANEEVPRSDMALLREIAPRILDGKTVGSGHFCQLEVPEQVNAMIERFLTIAVPA